MRAPTQLWLAYLSERLEAARGLSPANPNVTALNNTFERAMVAMHKMPRIWLLYLEFMTGQARARGSSSSVGGGWVGGRA